MPPEAARPIVESDALFADQPAGARMRERR